MKHFFSGFGQFLAMWAIGTLIFVALVALTGSSVGFYTVAPFIAVVWAMVAVIGVETERLKKKKVVHNKQLLWWETYGYYNKSKNLEGAEYAEKMLKRTGFYYDGPDL